jgi:Flp pilus assembly CpaF family ATPase
VASDGTRERQLEKLRRDLGEVFLRALEDPDTVEIMLNADGTLWQERLGEQIRPIGTMSGSSAEAAMRTIALNGSIRELTVRMALRMRPGRMRGPEALDLLMAWNTGHEGGIATLHANNAAAGLTRLSTLVSMHRSAVEGHAQQIDKHHCD